MSTLLTLHNYRRTRIRADTGSIYGQYKISVEWNRSSGYLISGLHIHYFSYFISQKYLFDHIKSLQCYELIRRCSPLPLMLASQLTYDLHPLAVNGHWCRDSYELLTIFTFRTHSQFNLQRVKNFFCSLIVIVSFYITDTYCVRLTKFCAHYGRKKWWNVTLQCDR